MGNQKHCLKIKEMTRFMKAKEDSAYSKPCSSTVLLQQTFHLG